MTVAPQSHEGVLLLSGKSGWIRGVISYWGRLRCWDVYVMDPDHRADAPIAFHDVNVRVLQVREHKDDPVHQWREVQP